MNIPLNSKENFLIIEPINGLGNRFRAMASGYILALALGRTLKVLWKSENGPKNAWYVPPANVIFEELLPNFLNPNEFEITDDETSIDTFAGGYGGEQRLLPQICNSTKKIVHIKAGGIFKPDTMKISDYNNIKSLYYKSLINYIKPSILNNSHNFHGQKVLGVHIRRGDRKQYTAPTKLFVQKINKLIRNSKFKKLFICTDDQQEIEYIRNNVKGIPIVCRQEQDTTTTTTTRGAVTRETDQDFMDALADWLSLSTTDCILISKGSSFSYEACFLKKIKGIEILKRGVESKFPPITF